MSFQHDIVLLGETHGDPKNPERIREVLNRFDTKVTFVLELHERVEPYLLKYFEDGSKEIFECGEVKRNPGKITQDILKLFKEIKDKHNIKFLKHFPIEKEKYKGDAFDKEIAKQLKKMDKPVVALLGSTHATKEKINLKNWNLPKEIKQSYKNKTMKPVGYHLKNKAHSIKLGKPMKGYDEHIS